MSHCRCEAGSSILPDRTMNEICEDCCKRLASYEYPRNLCDACWVNWWATDSTEEEKSNILEGIREIHFELTGKFPSEYDIPSRAELSMQPWELTEEQAAVIEKALEDGTARPKIAIKKLPEYIAT